MQETPSQCHRSRSKELCKYHMLQQYTNCGSYDKWQLTVAHQICSASQYFVRTHVPRKTNIEPSWMLLVSWMHNDKPRYSWARKIRKPALRFTNQHNPFWRKTILTLLVDTYLSWKSQVADIMENKSPEDPNYKFKNCVNNFGIALMCIDQVDLTCAELSIRYRE